MKYFIIPDQGHDYKIMKVQDEDVAGFRRRYVGEILIEGDSIAELLLLFSAKLESLRD